MNTVTTPMNTDTTDTALVFDTWQPVVTSQPFQPVMRKRSRPAWLAVGYRRCPHGHDHFDPTISEYSVVQYAYVVGPPACPDEECKAAVTAARRAGRA